jgi:Ca2+-binding EF-hand superfamily protein
MAYFQEPVVENPNENFRIRKCTIFYYLDDDTLHITEKRIENSGLTQGVFLKRHQVPKEGGGNYTYRDLNLGMNLDVYGRVFRVIDCDEFTRKFFNNEGLQLNQAERYPDDTFAHTRAMINMKQTPPDEAEQKEYVEVLRGGGNPNKALAEFLDNDRKVLSYKILWNDNAYDGGQKFYVLNFFLSDNCVEVKEINEQNTGRFPFPMLMKKQKLAKQPIMTHCPGMSLRKEEFYMPQDLLIGTQLDVYGRKVMIYDCDAYTKAWYKANLNHDQVAIQLKKAQPNLMYEAVPPYNGYGKEEDSLGSVYSLQPKPPKVDMKKMFKQDMHILRFECKLISTEPDDESRKFIISFYCGDDTIQVYEVCDKNSGRMGGKFMERKKHKNPVGQIYYAEKDFLIGRTIFLGGYKFQLQKADDYTEKYMEDNPDIFKEQSLDYIINKIKKGASAHNSLQEYAIALMQRLDKNGDGFISFQEFTAGLRELNIFITHHEEHALMRRFDSNGDGKISMEEFYNTLAASF